MKKEQTSYEVERSPVVVNGRVYVKTDRGVVEIPLSGNEEFLFVEPGDRFKKEEAEYEKSYSVCGRPDVRTVKEVRWELI